MSKSSMTRSITVLFVLVISVALVSADLLITSAQNSNSSTTTQDEQTRGGMMTSQNGNTSNTAGRRGRRRRRRAPRRTNMSGDMSNTNMTGDMSGNTNMTDDSANTSTDASSNENTTADMSGNMGGRRRRRRGRRSMTTTTAAAPADPSVSMQTGTERTDGGVQEDLAGQSYTGTVNYSEGGLSGPATLTFESGNQFTLTPEGGTAISGRYTAVTTRGYTGVTMMLGGSGGSTPASIVSVRLRRTGNGVTIMSVPGETRQFSFTSSGRGGSMTAGGGGGGRRRGRRRRGRTRGGIKPPMVSAPETPTTP